VPLARTTWRGCRVASYSAGEASATPVDESLDHDVARLDTERRDTLDVDDSACRHPECPHVGECAGKDVAIVYDKIPTEPVTAGNGRAYTREAAK
jgi:hypothetical protein